MLFRNALKLVVARKANDVISIGFLSNAGGLFSARLNSDAPAINTVHEIQAQIGPFGEVNWRFKGEEVKKGDWIVITDEQVVDAGSTYQLNRNDVKTKRKIGLWLFPKRG